MATGPVSATGPGTALTSAQGSDVLLRELGQVQGYRKVKANGPFYGFPSATHP